MAERVNNNEKQVRKMNYQGIITTFAPLSDEQCLKILFVLHEDEMTALKLAGRCGIENAALQKSLQNLLDAGLVSSVEKQGETRYFLSPFGTFGAVNMLKEVLCVEQGCKGCSI